MERDIVYEEWDNVYPPLEDTLLLAKNIDVRPGDKVLEIGCGTGYVSIAAAMMGGIVEGVDINAAAVSLSSLNAKKNGVKNARFHIGDMFENVDGPFDVIIFNPPYLPSERMDTDIYDKCWDGGEDGREVTDRFLDGLRGNIKEGGSIFLLQSSFCDPERTMERLCSLGFSSKVIAKEKLFFEELFVIRSTYMAPR
ncbi:MAG: methyltransferase [Candidatus Methanofastidiosa archaeon]|nr:methyltransferase [Candidatus Methanofastidiosa archaeon]